MWSKKHKNCQSCKSTLFQHIGKGLCKKCYRVIQRKSNLNKELNSLNDEDIINKKRPLLPHKYLNITNRKELIDVFLRQEEAKLYYLKFYGKLESGEMTLDLPKFELIFNDISLKMKRDKSFFTQKLNRLFTSLDEEQRKVVIMQLLKLLIK
jgi:hypothetical protein